MNAARPRVAWVTNDLPPHSGGIQQFVGSLLERTADEGTLVLGPCAPRGREGAAHAADAAGRWRVVRSSGRLLPTPATVRWLLPELVEHRPDVIVIASLWPMGYIVRGLRRAIDVPILALTHGAEAGLARGPGRVLLRRIAREVDALTVISDHTEEKVGGALGDRRLVRLAPGVDPARFAAAEQEPAAAALRSRWGVPDDAPVVGCVARLVPRKGQDMLLKVWPEVLRHHPGAHLVLVGEGPLHRRLARTASRTTNAHVVGPVSWDELPAAYAALDLFAMPVRTRLCGLDVEGLGISYLEAQAAGLPVIAGRSGGAPETVADARVGSIVDGRDTDELLAALLHWLSAADARDAVRTLGPRSATGWSWDVVAQRFAALIDELARG